jgi:diguanylate cyclase (GGDEF)-like protein/PAS domain S-box-containing protein
MVLVLAVSIPLVVIVGIGIYADMQQANARTKTSLRIVASTMVRNTGGKIAETRAILERLAVRSLVRRLDPRKCDQVLKDLFMISASYANVAYANLDGWVICSAVPQPGGKPINISKTQWFRKFLQNKSFSIGEPLVGLITGKWVTVLSSPIRNENHEMVGVVYLPLDLNAYNPNIPDQLLPAGSHYGFLSESGVLVWRNVDPQGSMGSQTRSESVKRIVQLRDGEIESVSSDGVTRFYSVLSMPESGWIAWVGVPVSAVYAEGKQRAIVATVAALVTIVLIYLIAIAIARRITRPVAELEGTARRVRGGDLGVRAAVGGPSDIAAVAEEFNAMVNAQQLSVEQLRVAATAFESQESMMITDAKTVILRVNQAFTESTGYKAEEAVGQTPRILKSDRHSADFYREMWETIRDTGIWRGEIWDRRKNGEIYPKWLTVTAVKNTDGVVTHYVGSHIDITERKAAEEKINNLAFYDPLTQLPNRRLLMDRLQHALAASARGGSKGALLFIDLDNFKTLNDTLGHEVGDLLLQQLAQRLTSCVREGDTVSRLGGDEFVLVLENLSEQALDAATHAENISEKIKAALNQSCKLGLHEYKCTSSIGVTVFDGYQSPIEELMKQADIAMYQAKKAGRNAVCFYDQQMQENISARVLLESELHKAFEQQQFLLYYQIQVDSSSRPLGAETLVRWQHPTRGIVYPEEFIPLAEESGLILPLGHWVLTTACQQLAAWSVRPETAHLTVSVNVCAKQFHLPIFVEEILALIDYFGIDPAKLKLEITESMLLDRVDDTIVKMNMLKARGINFSLDDFGTGYSSLQYLKRLPLDQVKIDQSFVRDIATDNNDKAIVRTIMAMAQSMSLEVIAEGVETEEQRLLLMSSGCARFQGYLFGRPVPLEEFEASLKQRNRLKG